MKKPTNPLQILIRIAEQPRYAPEDIARVMVKHGLNERSLALILNLTQGTVRLWMLGKAKPCNPSCRLLQILEMNAGFVDELATAVPNGRRVARREGKS